MRLPVDAHVDANPYYILPRSTTSTVPRYAAQRWQQYGETGVMPRLRPAGLSALPQIEPKVLVLVGSIAPGRSLAEPLVLTVARDIVGDETLIVVSEHRLNVYGVGETVAEAVDEFVSMLLDLFSELVSSESILSSHLHRELHFLRLILLPH